MRCKYDGSGVWDGRCTGTKELDLCPGHGKCSHYTPEYRDKLSALEYMEKQLQKHRLNYERERARGVPEHRSFLYETLFPKAVCASRSTNELIREDNMKRLTFDGLFCDIAQCKETPGGTFCENGSCSQRKVWERLKEYEDMEEQGRLVVLPCKVGDTVWDKEVEPWDVVSVEWFSRKVINIRCVSPVSGGRRTFSVGKRSIGKTVFLTHEEAERALEGGQNNAIT